ncbi:putative uncharacterized oxidoreductase [Diplonema papillatum]|nr:putative uncharacterized oxidoreductase [Diplonema papillatum]
MFQSTGMLRPFSNSCLDLYGLEDGEDVERLSPRSRGKKLSGFGSSDADEDRPSMPRTPPGRGQVELKKTFSGSCLELDNMISGSDPPTPANRHGLTGRHSPLHSQHTSHAQVRQIFEYVHNQNTRRRLLDRHKSTTVLVTGAGAPGSGFLATHIIAKLLHEGYEVRATIRDSSYGNRLIDETKSTSGAKLEVVHGADPQAGHVDALEDALHGADYVVHCPSTGGGVMGPRDGVRNVFEGIRRLKVALRKRVKRVVMTSSAVAVHDPSEEVLTEDVWNTATREEDPIGWGRVEAEREAWTLAKEIGVELSVVITTTVVGPSLGGEVSESLKVIRDLVCSSSYFPFAPRIARNFVDVTDVAAAHVLALDSTQSPGQRYIVAGENFTLSEIGLLIKERYPYLSPPTRNAWDWLTLTVVPLMNHTVSKAALKQQLGGGRQYSTRKARLELGLTIKAPTNAILDTVEDLVLRRELDPSRRSPDPRSPPADAPLSALCSPIPACTVVAAVLLFLSMRHKA